MKSAKKMLTVFLIVMLVSTLAIGMTACDKHRDNESSAFSMSIQNPDGVFNPFFSTSAYDSSIISLTQISMLNTDKEGTLIAGLNQPTVALDFNVQTVYVDGDDPTGPATPVGENENPTHTDYSLLIKNGLKFSDGHDLTIKDVLFNLYVYLDPVFTGSATIYSTDIVGLNDYRTQEGNKDEASMSAFELQFNTAADTALTELIAWVKYYSQAGIDVDDIDGFHYEWRDYNWDADFEFTSSQSIGDVKYSYQDIRDKINHIASLYHDELMSDWNAINMEDYKKPEWPGFTEPWQVFLLNDIGATNILQTLSDGKTLDKTDDGTYKLNVAEAQREYESIVNEYQDGIINTMPEGNAKQEAIRDAFIESRFTTVFGSSVEKITNGDVVTYEVTVPDMGSAFEEVVSNWGTANTVWDELVAEAKSNYFTLIGEENEGGLEFPNIKGIWVERNVTSFNNKTYAQGHDVLHIRINDIDPKALMNFAFTVAPMHYYSSPEEVENVEQDWAKWEAAGAKPEEFNTYVTHFGVKYANPDFMNNEINSKVKIVKPLGAGAYQASNDAGEEDFYKVTGSGSTGFFNNNIIFYTRNNYFWTVGADGGSQESSQLQNAKIKKVVYKVVASDQIIASLARGDIDFGDPSATPQNKDELDRAGLTVAKTMTAGYGYIGINPRYIPEVEVRQAIMMAMDIDTTMITDYYKGKDFAERIYRPMSKTSWAYPEDAEEMYPYDATGEDIKALVEKAGYKMNSATGLYEKNDKTLNFKFTIAGGSTDHPAYSCFLNAQSLLNGKCGFNVQVVTSAQALTDLSAGKLAVWAAAWSSAIDPDMYQVYHINSQASSTSNWGYKQIKADPKGEKYKDEYDIIVSLSELIDAARETNEQDNRARIYSDCLDLVMELAVELPTYQRYDIAAYNSKVIDSNSLPKHNTGNDKTDEISPYYGLLSRIWEVSFVK